MDLIKIAEEAFATGKQHPSFKAGDTVTVAYRIVEGNKERVQLYRGVVIKIAGHGDKKRFTVRKMSGTVGVERIFPIESPAIDSIEVNKVGKVRRAKLYYLRALTGKKARIKERWVKFVALNCTTCALLPVRKQELKKKESTVNSELLFLNKKGKPIDSVSLF
ncbi:putative uncharacterized protein [Bacteroides clarus CAG:160]|nr:putative uncharacterized protein [Bacteroides clarus CAG:160]